MFFEMDFFFKVIMCGRYEYVGDDDIKVLMINVWFLYVFEYLGNSGCLVIIFLIDRCYCIFMGVFYFILGGVFEGFVGS